MVRMLLLTLVSMILLVTGQSLLKYGLMRAGGVNFTGGEIRQGFRTILTSPYVIFGFAAYGLSALIWLDVLSKLEFSYAFPMMSLTYVFTLLVGHFVFGEIITWVRVLGVLVIITGVTLVAQS